MPTTNVWSWKQPYALVWPQQAGFQTSHQLSNQLLIWSTTVNILWPWTQIYKVDIKTENVVTDLDGNLKTGHKISQILWISAEVKILTIGTINRRKKYTGEDEIQVCDRLLDT